MWYVVHCPNQDVYQVMHTLRRKMHPFTIRSVQVPSCDRKFKYHGEWHVEERPLFLERVFVECGEEADYEKQKSANLADAAEKSETSKIRNCINDGGDRTCDRKSKSDMHPRTLQYAELYPEYDWTPLADTELEFLREFCAGGFHLGMSEGYICDGQTHVTTGPLVGKETHIRKIDRHKRLAWVEVPEIAGVTQVCVGLEIENKTVESETTEDH